MDYLAATVDRWAAGAFVKSTGSGRAVDQRIRRGGGRLYTADASSGIPRGMPKFASG